MLNSLYFGDMSLLNNIGVYRVSFIGGSKNECYIGQTSLNFKTRFMQHINCFINGTCSKRFQFFIKKFGLENLRFEILLITSKKEESIYFEKQLINHIKPEINLEVAKMEKELLSMTIGESREFPREKHRSYLSKKTELKRRGLGQWQSELSSHGFYIKRTK